MALGVRTLVFITPDNALPPVGFVALFLGGSAVGVIFQTQVRRENMASFEAYETKYRHESGGGQNEGKV